MEGSLSMQILELIRRSSTDLPGDVEGALRCARDAEEPESSACSIFENILENVEMARRQQTPICQDTGSLLFEIEHPYTMRQEPLRAAVESATVAATRSFFLRPNAVEPLSGKNSGNNLGDNVPVLHFHPWDREELVIRLLQKGGGSENVSGQFKLPDSRLDAGRDLDGVRKGVLDLVHQAQGKGCAPGILGVAIGGDRASSLLLAKAQLFRPLGQRSTEPRLAELELRLLSEANALGIGPMGLGGKTTLLEVFVASQHRHPATFYVSVAYMCWACRRATLTVHHGEASYA